MSVKWLLETDTFKENLGPMQEAIKAQGMDFEEMKYIPFGGTKLEKDYKQPVVFYGSLNFAKDILRKTDWLPGVYCNGTNLSCSHYYSYLGHLLLNHDYIMIPYGELKRRKNDLYRFLGVDDTLFMRPSSGFKQFAGQLVYADTYDQTVDHMGLGGMDIYSIVVIARPKVIFNEWRVVIVKGKAVAASLYRKMNRKILDKGAPDDVMEYAELVAKTWEPERAFVADIALTHDSLLKLIELNSFSCAGLYACDQAKVVKTVSELAQEDWNEVYAAT